jgi:hypothetical protein
VLQLGHRAKAFDAARASLQDRAQLKIVYEIIARRIIEAAKKGERDRDRLRDAGLAALGHLRLRIIEQCLPLAAELTVQ